MIEAKGLRSAKTSSVRFKLDTKRRSAWFRVRKIVKNTHVILEVLDSRDPVGTRSLDLEILIKGLGKKLILVLNKADLLPKNVVNNWIKYFKLRGYIVYAISAKKGWNVDILKKVAKRLARRRRVILAIVGYPNVGKSTIINSFKGRHVAGTSPIPGFTKGEKLIRIDEDIFVVDTPGLLASKTISRVDLAVRGFIPPEQIKKPLTPALKFVDNILSSMPNLLKETYGIDSKESYRFLEVLAEKRGFLIKGGELNIDEAARTILRDWQSGKLIFYKFPKD